MTSSAWRMRRSAAPGSRRAAASAASRLALISARPVDRHTGMRDRQRLERRHVDLGARQAIAPVVLELHEDRVVAIDAAYGVLYRDARVDERSVAAFHEEARARAPAAFVRQLVEDDVAL